MEQRYKFSQGRSFGMERIFENEYHVLISDTVCFRAVIQSMGIFVTLKSEIDFFQALESIYTILNVIYNCRNLYMFRLR